MLKINDNSKVLIKILIDRANENPIYLDEMHAIMDGKKKPIGNNQDFSCIINGEYRAVYSIEQHPSHMMKHISISHKEDKYPSPEDVAVIIEEFGFKNKLEERKNPIYFEEHVAAINIIVAAINIMEVL